MKKYFVMAALAVSTLTASAQSVVPKWINNVKLSGFGIVQYTYNGQENNESNSFNLRLARLALDGRAFDDWYWKAQIQFNGNTSTLGSSPKLVDLFIEWQKYDFLRVKAGQFKNPFTYENPMHPIDQGFMSYSQVISKFPDSATALVHTPATDATSACSCRVTSSRMPADATSSTTRWASSTVRAST